MSQHHLSVKDQIAETERAIWAGNDRLHDLFSELKVSAKERLKPSRKTLIIAAVALVAGGLLLYPRRHAIARGLHGAAHHPMVGGLLQRLPLVGAVLPLLLGSLAGGKDGGGKGGGIKSGLMGSLVSMGLPLLTSFFRHAPSKQPPVA